MKFLTRIRNELKMGNKGQIGLLVPAVITVVIAALAIGIGALVLTNFNSGLVAGSAASLAVLNGVTAVGTFSSNLGTIVFIVVGAIMLGLLVGFLTLRGGGGRQ